MLAAEIGQFFFPCTMVLPDTVPEIAKRGIDPKRLLTFFVLNGDDAQLGQLRFPLIADADHYQIMPARQRLQAVLVTLVNKVWRS